MLHKCLQTLGSIIELLPAPINQAAWADALQFTLFVYQLLTEIGQALAHQVRQQLAFLQQIFAPHFNIWNGGAGGSSRRGGAIIGNEIGDGEICLVADAARSEEHTS